MNKYNYMAVGFSTLLLLAACSKSLDTTPTQSIDQTDALKTNEDVQVALVGAYSDLGDGDVYGGGFFVYPDLLGDATAIIWTGTYQGLTQINNNLIPVNNGFITDSWLDAYKAINDANNVLSALDVVNDDEKDRVEGEAKFIRGITYFDLVRLYAKAWNDGDPASNPGVPIVLTPTRSITEENQVPRSSVSDVYAQAISDLTDARAKLPDANGFFATKYAAAAMLARIYLQKADYANAAEAASFVIASGKFSLNSNYADEFPYSPQGPTPISNTAEDIFAIQVNATQGINDMNTYYSSNGRGDISITDAHLDLYTSNDDRLNLFYLDGGSVFTGKFENAYGNVHVVRLAEMFLIRSEANYREGTMVGDTPLNDINKIRNRAGLASLGSADLNVILDERMLELAFEGIFLHDAKRLERSVGPLAWDSPKLIFPIPDREIKVNSKLTQNEGY